MRQYFITDTRSGQTTGPYTEAQLLALIKTKGLESSCLVKYMVPSQRTDQEDISSILDPELVEVLVSKRELLELVEKSRQANPEAVQFPAGSKSPYKLSQPASQTVKTSNPFTEELPNPHIKAHEDAKLWHEAPSFITSEKPVQESKESPARTRLRKNSAYPNLRTIIFFLQFIASLVTVIIFISLGVSGGAKAVILTGGPVLLVFSVYIIGLSCLSVILDVADAAINIAENTRPKK